MTQPLFSIISAPDKTRHIKMAKEKQRVPQWHLTKLEFRHDCRLVVMAVLRDKNAAHSMFEWTDVSRLMAWKDAPVALLRATQAPLNTSTSDIRQTVVYLQPLRICWKRDFMSREVFPRTPASRSRNSDHPVSLYMRSGPSHSN